MRRRTFVNRQRSDTIAIAAREIGATIRAARESRGDGQDVAASSVGTWQKAVSLFERGNLGRSITVPTLLELADRYGLKLVLIEKDADVARYRTERDAASTRRRSPQRDLFAEAKAEFDRWNTRREVKSA